MIMEKVIANIMGGCFLGGASPELAERIEHLMRRGDRGKLI
jgi:hypothetical protein